MTEKSMVAAGATAMADMTFSDMQSLARSIAASGLFGIRTPDQALSLMAISAAEGLHPALAARDYHIVQGRPTLKADAMLARFQTAGGVVRWTEYGDERVTGVFSHPSSPEPVTVTWTLAQARSACLANKDVWKQYPRAMLRARVISEGIRTVYPGVLVGTYTPEEVAEFAPTADAVSIRHEHESTTAERADDPLKTIGNSDMKLQIDARIRELGLDERRVNAFCSTQFSVDTVSELTPAQADRLVQWLPRMASKAARESLLAVIAGAQNTAALNSILIGRKDYAAISDNDWDTFITHAIDARWQSLDNESGHAPPVSMSERGAKAARDLRVLDEGREIEDEAIAESNETQST